MSAENFEPDSPLDRAIREIREEPIDSAVVEAAAARAWARITGEAQPHAVEKIRSCDDFQALLPDYRAGRLTEARRLLVEDHVHECVKCRKALEGATKVVAFPAPRPAFRFSYRWAVAAAVLIGAGLTAWGVLYYVNAPWGSRTTVAVVNGSLYRVSDQGSVPVKAGDELPPGAEVRTAKDSNAVIRLRDGSLVEMRERSGFTVAESRKDLTINLGLGSIIVQAAKRRSGHLFVATRDFRVAVTGTVFSVNSGVKGSRVSVIEGEVHVTKDKEQKVLHPGDQFASNPSMSPVPVQEEIAWSRNLDQHLAMLKELSALQKQLEQVHFPELRYTSRLIGLVPASTSIYVSIPNLGRTLAEAQQVIRQRVAESPVLRPWWNGMENRPGPKLDEMIDRIRAFSEYLGDEIVLAVPKDASGKLGDFVLLAELKQPGFKEFVQSELARLGGHPGELRIVTDAAEAPEGARGAWMLVRPDLVVLAPSASALREVTGPQGGFPATPFGNQIAEAYRNGAGILFSADLEQVTAKMAQGKDRSGLSDIRSLMVEQKESGGRTDMRATVNFSGPRKGFFGWLAAPAPLRSLDFMSPEAGFVAAFAMKSPAKALDEVLTSDALADQHLLEAEEKLGFNVRSDLAAALGGEFAVALDGPVLPPAWKLVVEVYDASRFQWVIQKFVDMHNRECVGQGKPAVELSQEAANGRTYYSLKIPGMPFGEAQYTFVDGYLLAAPNRQLVDRAIQYRATGYTLPRSAQFMALAPRDHYSNFSAMVYQNAGPAVAPLAGLLGGTSLLTPDQQKSLGDIASQLKPTLFTAYGEPDRITVAGNGSLFGLSINNLIQGNLLGIGGGMRIPGLFGNTGASGRGRHPAVYR